MKKLFALVVLLTACNAFALDVGDISSFMDSDATVLSKEIKNTTDSGRFINIAIKRISSPLADGKIIPMESPDEMLLTPSSILIPSQSTEVVRFFYKGPTDDKERYYRIFWQDQLLSDKQQDSAKKLAIATASARISTILVVAPRTPHYQYQYHAGEISNTGNVTLKVIAYGVCINHAEKNDCKEDYYVMPGKKRHFTHVDVNNEKGHVAFWQADQFVPVK